MKILLFFTLLLSSFATNASNKAEIHVSNMLNMYTSLTEYEDSGKTNIKMTRKSGDIFIEKKTFKTLYTKNTLLKFQWTVLPTKIDEDLYSISNNAKYLEPKIYTVWKDKTGAYTKYNNKEKMNHKSTSAALSSATGISNGLAWLVPRFLAPEISCPPSLNATRTQIINENDKIITIKQILPSGTIQILHINRNTYLLHKYESISELPSGTKSHQISQFNVTKYN